MYDNDHLIFFFIQVCFWGSYFHIIRIIHIFNIIRRNWLLNSWPFLDMVSDWMANWLLIFPTDGLPYIGAKPFSWTIMIKGLEICPIHLPRLRNLKLLQPKTTYGSTIIFYTICLLGTFNNSLWLSEAFIHQETSQALAQFMASCLFGAKPSSKLMLDKC